MTLLDLHSRSQLRLKLAKMLNVYYNSHISDSMLAMTSKLGMAVDVCMAYMLMLVSVTLTMMQGDAKLQC